MTVSCYSRITHWLVIRFVLQNALHVFGLKTELRQIIFITQKNNLTIAIIQSVTRLFFLSFALGALEFFTLSTVPSEETEDDFQEDDEFEFFQDMAVKKWSNVYVKTSPTHGVVMLLIEKKGPDLTNDAQWTAVDATSRIQVVTLRNKGVFSLKANRGITYAPMRGFSERERRELEIRSWEVAKKEAEQMFRDPQQIGNSTARTGGRNRRNAYLKGWLT